MNPSGISETLMKVRPGVEISGQSDIGCQRENNEDSFGYWEPDDDQQFLRKGRLAIVADGMGGYEGGQEASHLAVETVTGFYRDQDGANPQLLLKRLYETAHERVRQHGFAHPRLRGMGTTSLPSRWWDTRCVTSTWATRGFTLFATVRSGR